MTRRAFTLIELLIVVSIISILAVLAVTNFRQATERTLRAADAANLRTIGVALQSYFVDHNALPPADREAGPFPSHTRDFHAAGNGPAAGGSWDGLPWLLHERGYISDWRTMFTPKYLRLYDGGGTLRGDQPRYHNFRYAYNSSALSSGGHIGGSGNIESGSVWLVRNLWLGPRDGFYGGAYPRYPADFAFPWGEGELEGKLEHALYADMTVRLVVGGTNTPPGEAAR